MNYRKYMEKLKYSKIGGNLKYLLIYEKNNNLNFIEGSELNILANVYSDSLSPDEALRFALKRFGSNTGKLYKLGWFKYNEIARI